MIAGRNIPNRLNTVEDVLMIEMVHTNVNRRFRTKEYLRTTLSVVPSLRASDAHRAFAKVDLIPRVAVTHRRQCDPPYRSNR